MEDVREYLHLYKGSMGRMFKPKKQEWTEWTTIEGEFIYTIESTGWTPQIQCRRLDSMTEEEVKEIFMLVFRTKFTGTNIGHVFKGRDNSHWGAHSGLSRLLIFTKSCDIIADNDLVQHRVNQPKVITYLLSKGFWLFGNEAFDKGLIIDSKTLNKEV